jgi:hypothetical protein
MAGQVPGQVDAGQDPCAERFGVALHPGQLAGKEHWRTRAGSEAGAQAPGTVDVGIAVDAAIAKELRLGQPGNRAEDALLLGNPESGLEPDQVPHLAGPILATELDHGVGFPPSARVGQPDRLHRAEAQRFGAPRRHLLHRQASLEVGHRIEVVAGVLVGGRQGGDELLVPLAIQRRVEVVVAIPLAVAGQPVEAVVIEGLVRHDRRDGIVEGQRGRAEPRADGIGQGLGGEGTGGDDPRPGQLGHLAGDNGDQRVGAHLLVHGAGKEVAIHDQR